MKKHDEGYVMLLVVVVILVLSIVSASLMSITVANLKNQRNSVKRMQEKYSAQGELEKEIAKIQSSIPKETTGIKVTTLGGQSDEYKMAAVEKWFKDTVGIEPEEEKLLPPDETGTFHYKVLLSAGTDAMEVTCELKLTGKVTLDETDPDLKPVEEENPDSGRNGEINCNISIESLTYTSYEITEKEVQPSE